MRPYILIFLKQLHQPSIQTYEPIGGQPHSNHYRPLLGKSMKDESYQG